MLSVLGGLGAMPRGAMPICCFVLVMVNFTLKKKKSLGLEDLVVVCFGDCILPLKKKVYDF